VPAVQSRAACLSSMGLTRAEEEELSLWRRAVETLLARGASPAEAIDGANLIAQAFRRKMEEAEAKGDLDAANDVDPAGPDGASDGER
jgi:hypothetical protein